MEDGFKDILNDYVEDADHFLAYLRKHDLKIIGVYDDWPPEEV